MARSPGAPWADDALVLDSVHRPFRPVEHPEAATRKRLATQREELLRTLERERDGSIAKAAQAAALERMAQAVSAGLAGNALSATPLGLSMSAAARLAAKDEPTAEGAAALAQPPRHRRGFAVPRTATATKPSASVEASRSEQGEERAGTASLSASMGLPRPQPPPAREGADGPEPPSAGRAATASASLPEELLTLIRKFRAAVEVVSASGSAGVEQDAIKEVSVSASALTRYVTAYIVSRDAERAEEQEAKLRGWMRKRPNPTGEGGDSLDPISTFLALTQGVGSPQPSPRSGQPGRAKGRQSMSGSRSTLPPDASRRKSTAAKSAQQEATGPLLTEADPMLRRLCSAALLSVHVLLDAVLDVTCADRASLFLYDPQTNELCSVAMVGSAAVIRPFRVPPDVGAAGAVYRTGIAINIPNTDKAPPSLFSREMGHRSGYYTRSLLTCPVVARRGARASRTDGVIGVVQVINKQRPANSGFNQADEDLVGKLGCLIGSIITSAGDDATFTGTVAAEEGIRSQMLVHSYHELANANRGRVTTTTAAGSVDLTITEAKAMQASQRQQERRIAQTDPSNTASNGADKAANRLVGELARSTGESTLLVYRTATGAPKEERSGAAAVLSEILDSNVRDLAAFLERVEESWKETRELCLKHEATIARLQAERGADAAIRARLLRLCTEAGLLDEAEIATLSGQQGDGRHVEEDKDEDLDDATFEGRVAEHYGQLVDRYQLRLQQQGTRARLREQAAARPHEVASRELAAQRIAESLALQVPAADVADSPLTRKPLAVESEREQRNREYAERRAAHVRDELQSLVRRQQAQQARLLQRQHDETVQAYKRIMLEDAEAASILARVFGEARLDPQRHTAVNELLERFTVARQSAA